MGDVEDEIIGCLAAEETLYKFKVPAELHEIIVDMQNALCDKYTDLNQTRQILRKQEDALKQLLK